jgi:hypothetical protein
MLITHIHTEGLKGQTWTHEIGPLTFIYGPNASGKTAHLDVVRLVVTKSTFRVGRTNEAILSLATGKKLKIGLTMSDGQDFTREWKEATRKGKVTVSQKLSWSGGTTKNQAEAAIENIFGVKSLMMDPLAFLEASEPKRRETILAALKWDKWSPADVAEVLRERVEEISKDTGVDPEVLRELPAPKSKEAIEAAIEISGGVHERFLEIDRTRKGLEKTLEGMAEIAEAVSGQVIKVQKERIAKLRENVKGLRERRGQAQAQQREMARWRDAVAEQKTAEKKIPEMTAKVAELKATKERQAKIRSRLEELGYEMGTQSLQLQQTKVLLATAQAGTCKTCGQAISKEMLADLETQAEMIRLAVAQTEKQIADAKAESTSYEANSYEKAATALAVLKGQLKVAPVAPPEPADIEQIGKDLLAAEEAVNLAAQRLEELEKQRAAAALRDQKERELQEATKYSSFWKQLDVAMGTKGLLGSLLSGLSESFGQEISRTTALPVGIDATGDRFIIGCGRPVVPLEGLSGAQQAELLVAIASAIERARGGQWRGTLVDDADRFDGVSLPRFLETLERAVEQGWINQAIVCGWYDPRRPDWLTINTEDQ